MKKHKIVIASDSFKEACTSLEAGLAIKKGLEARLKGTNISVFSVGDGGEGTAEAIIESLKYSKRAITVHDTHGSLVNAEYGVSPDGTAAVFDMAACSGIKFARAHGLDILNSSTEGVGEMIRAAICSGCREIIIGLGGSGTCDGGIGALSSLGAVFYDANGQKITKRICTSTLGDVRSCDFDPVLKLLKGVKLTLLYDSGVPLLGKNGAVMMYSQQKGATDEMLPRLEKSMKNFSAVCDMQLNKSMTLQHGSGAAGGLGYGLSLIGGQLIHGAEYVLDITGFTKAAENADVVITGEGKTDRQTATGKLPLAAAQKVRMNGNSPLVICLCGVNDATEELYEGGISAVFQIGDRPMTSEESLNETLRLLEKCAYNLGGII